MCSLWSDIYLPVIQKINDHGGNVIGALVSRAVIEEIDECANGRDSVLIEKRRRMVAALKKGNWPYDPDAFNAFFEVYHEALFFILAKRRSVELVAIPEGPQSTPDFSTVATPIEAFEIKTIDFSGGAFAYRAVCEDALDARIDASEQAKTEGFGLSGTRVQPHGDAKDSKEAIERVMRQIGGNVKADQFSQYPTFLVVPMVRTALRMRAEELDAWCKDPEGGDPLSGHLWTIARHVAGEEFCDATEFQPGHSLGSLERAGILEDFPFVRGLVFLHTEWNELPGADVDDRESINRCYRLYGVWNPNPSKSQGSSCPVLNPTDSAFDRLCDAWSK